MARILVYNAFFFFREVKKTFSITKFNLFIHREELKSETFILHFSEF